MSDRGSHRSLIPRAEVLSQVDLSPMSVNHPSHKDRKHHSSCIQKTELEEIIHFAAGNPDIRNPQERWWDSTSNKIVERKLNGSFQVGRPTFMLAVASDSV